MKNLSIWLFVAIVLYSCNPNTKNSDPEILGYWAFLDKNGNYNEVHFKEHSYVTINRFVMDPPGLRYKIDNDTLLINSDPQTDGLKPIARLIWVDQNHVVVHSNFFSDTLERVNDPSATLEKLDPVGDSLTFWSAFYQRYEQFLIARSIITAEEAETFRETQQPPEDVIHDFNQ